MPKPHTTAAALTVITIVLGSTGCRNEERGIGRTSPPAPREAPVPPQSDMGPTILPSPPEAVTNTSAEMRRDPLLTIENRDQLKSLSGERMFTQGKPARLVAGTSPELHDSPGGNVIGRIRVVAGQNDQVNEIADDVRGDKYLIVYPDPRDAMKNLGGWVDKGALYPGTGVSESPETTEPHIMGNH